MSETPRTEPPAAEPAAGHVDEPAAAATPAAVDEPPAETPEPELVELDEPEEEGPPRPPLFVGERLARMVDENERQALEPEPVPEPEPGEEPPADPRARRCSVCRGWGILQTGSLVDGQNVRGCWHCGGIGFEEAQLVGPTTPLVAADQLEPAPEAPPAGAWVWPEQGR